MLTTGAETDLVETVFVTEGEKSVVDKSQCALSYQSLLQTDRTVTQCDFEGEIKINFNVSKKGSFFTPR